MYLIPHIPKSHMKIRTTYYPLLFLFIFLSCLSPKNKNQYVVAISLGTYNDAWQEALLLDMKVKASAHPELRLKIGNATNDNEKQAEQIRQFTKQKVDAMIIWPNESEAITPAAVEAFRQGIPTIILDRKINSDEYTTFIGTDNYEIGHLAGIFAESQLTDKAHILEIWGSRGSSSAQNRHKGFHDVISNRSNVDIQEIIGNWKAETTSNAIDSLKDFSQIDLVFAHNDLMALTARKVIEEKDPEAAKRIVFIGIDALPGKGLGVEAVTQGKLDATFYNPVCGSIAIKIAKQIIEGEAVAKRYALNSATIDQSNAGTLYLQSDRMTEYQLQIDRQQDHLEHLLSRYQFLESSLAIILVLMTVLVVLSGYVVYINRKIRRKNRLLYRTNRQVEQQREELSEAYQYIEQTTARKLQFFTNVSHEIKTPLTLILGPLNKMSQEVTPGSSMEDDIQIMQKNAWRLKRVVDQLLDFRKVENNKMNLRICRIDLTIFIRDLKSYFDNMAKSKKIHYSFETPLATAPAWVDTDKMEKILANLLSNAFKFTPEGGHITVRLNEEANYWVLSVEDNGTGIEKENLSSVFEQFFTGKQNYAQGTGIGLHLTREFVLMHKGEISVESEPFKKTLFTVKLPKGKSHFDSSCIFDSNVMELTSDIANVDISDIKANLSKRYDYTILITEDDPDIRQYQQKELSANFNVLVAENGVQALELLQEKEIDLVICDVLMPEMNGFELCKQIKSNISFSHIPVILLTALSEDNQRMYGFAKGADNYIQKPFNIEIVKLRIIQLLEERKRLRDTFSHQMSTLSEPVTTLEKIENMDDLFLKKFISLLETNYNDPNFNIEKGSDQLGLSRVHLYRKVKELTGATPSDFLRNFRLKRAAALLEQQSMTISEIAYATGFTSPAYFSKCFRTVYSITPTEYVRSLQ